MEDVLGVYYRPRDPNAVLVCVDEICKQLHSEVAPRLGTRPGDAAKEDYEYVREGSASLFMAFAPLEGKRHVYVSKKGTRRALDYADFLRLIAEEWFPNSPRIVLVEDNLNTHTDASLYKRFSPDLAYKLAQRFERHRTPKHGSWLNMAECELSVLARQCLARRIPNLGSLRKETCKWCCGRNNLSTTINWQFSSEDARVKLKKLYPTI